MYSDDHTGRSEPGPLDQELSDELVDEIRSGRMTRTELIRRAGVFGASASVLSLSGLTLTACMGDDENAADERARTVIWDMVGGSKTAPQLWNPFVPGYTNYDAGFHHWHDPFFILNYETNKIDPWLGESMEANSTLDEWTLRLQKGTTWNDGEPLTADDVIFTINLLIDNAPDLLESSTLQQHVKSMKKLDDRTIRFVLNEPNPRFQLNLFSAAIVSNFPIVPEHVWKDKDPLKFQNYDPDQGWPLNSGPYTLVSAEPARFVWARNDDWWAAKTGFKPLPAPEKMIWIAPGTNESKVAMMAKNEIDSLSDIPVSLFETLKDRNPNVITWQADKPYSWADPCVRVFQVNHTVEPWGDRDMRWALNYAIDRDQIVSIAYDGGTTPALTMFPDYETMRRYIDLIKQNGLIEQSGIGVHDPERAQAMITSKGWQKRDGIFQKDGKNLTMEILTLSELPEWLGIARVVNEQLQRIGIDTRTRNLSAGTYFEARDAGKYEAGIFDDPCGSVLEPFTSMERFVPSHVVPIGESAGGLNTSRWRNEEYGALVTQMGAFPIGDPRVDDLFVEAMRVWYRELPFIPITQAKALLAFNTTYWENWPTADNNYIHPPQWWDSVLEILVQLKPTS